MKYAGILRIIHIPELAAFFPQELHRFGWMSIRPGAA